MMLCLIRINAVIAAEVMAASAICIGSGLVPSGGGSIWNCSTSYAFGPFR